MSEGGHGGGHEEEVPENEEHWLLTYADMITLLVAFFIIMYSMSVTNMAKFKAVAVSIRSGFGGNIAMNKGNHVNIQGMSVIGQNSAMPTYAATVTDRKNNTRGGGMESAVAGRGQEQSAALILDRQFQTLLNLEPAKGPTRSIVITDQIYFDPGSADLTYEAMDKLDDIGTFLKTLKYPIYVEGYSSTYQPKESRFKNNWLLSSTRSAAVIDYLVSIAEVNPRRFTLLAYGEWKPAADPRRLTLANSGEWKQLFGDDVASASSDRVVITVLHSKDAEQAN